MRKKFFKILIILGLTGISFLFSSHFAFASFFLIDWMGKAVVWTCGKLAFLFGWLAGIVIDVENYFLKWVLGMNFHLMDSLILKRGWEISRDIANLGFALGILIISLATIANYQPYHARRLLARLIIAALLINFSLMICGIFVDFSGSFMKYFADACGSAENLGEMLQAAVKASAIHKGPPKDVIEGEFFEKEESTGGFKAALIAVGGLIFAAIFSIILVIVYAALIFLLFVRYVILVFLIILSPFAWVFWFLPTSLGEPGGVWQKWWTRFLTWIFFGPAVLFVVFLALSVLDPVISRGTPEMRIAQQISSEAANNKLVGATLARSSSPQSGISWLMQYALVIGILLLGMRFSLELSEGIGSGFYKAAEGVVAAPPRWVGRKIKGAGEKIRGAGRAITGAITGKAKERLVTAGKIRPSTRTGRILRKVTALPGVGRITRKRAEAREKIRGNVLEIAKGLEKAHRDEIERMLEVGNSQQKAAAVLALIRKGLWKEEKKYRDALRLLVHRYRVDIGKDWRKMIKKRLGG
ncbi:MAG TPA: hypothetical protein ENG32_00345 [bacterium]|nr:hypothetical protein [bacterium]